MTKDEALRLALEALNKLIIGSEYEDAVQAEDAIKACKEALAQPTLWMNCQTLADLIHYPKCWDIAAYPELDDALDEMVAWFEISGCSTCEEELAQPKQDLPTMDDAIAAGNGVLMNEQAALLRECRSALDSLIQQKPQLAGLLCGSTTLGNLKASLYGYRPQGVFNPKKWQDLTDEEIDKIRSTPMSVENGVGFNIYTYARAIEAKLKEKNT